MQSTGTADEEAKKGTPSSVPEQPEKTDTPPPSAYRPNNEGRSRPAVIPSLLKNPQDAP